MRLASRATRSARGILSLLSVALIAAALIAPSAVHAAEMPSPREPLVVAQESTTSSTVAAGETTDSSSSTTAVSNQGVESGPEAIIPPPADWVPLNPGWTTDQMDVRVLPEFDQRAVLVIVGFALPDDVQLPATLKLPIPAGATIAGIGEVDPSGRFVYNYADSYPEVEPGSEWDIATIEVQDFRQLQIDYYYDPGLPAEAGERSFQIMVQAPMDVTTLLLHVQQPARATDFQIQPSLQGSGQADDGFTYSVGTFSDVKAGSTLGQTVSYYKPDGGLSIDSEQSEAGTTQFNTNTVLLAAILVIVAIVGVLVVYRLYSSRGGGNRQSGGPKSSRGAQGAAAGTKRQRQADKGSKGSGSKSTASKSSGPKGQSSKGAGPKDVGAKDAVSESTEPAEASKTTDSTAEPGKDAAEYCVACGEELTTNDPFCPNCGEARP